MCELRLTVRILVTNGQSARLRIRQVGAAANFKVLLLSRAPCFDVAALVFKIRKVARAAAQLSYGDIQRTEQLHRVAPQLFVPFFAFFGAANDDHFLLLELVNTVNTPFFQAVCALFLSKTRGIGRQRQRKLCAVDDLPHESTDHRMFGRADKVQVFPFDFIHHVFHFVEAHYARNDVAMNHVRGNHVSEAFVNHKITRIRKHRGMQACNIARQIVESLPRSTARGIYVDTIQLFQNIQMVGNFKVGNRRLAKACKLDVFFIVLAKGHVVGNNIRNCHHRLFECCFYFRAFRFNSRKTLCVCLYLRLDFFSAFLIARLHQHAHLFGQGVSCSTKGVAFLNERTALCVQLQHFIYKRKLSILKLFTNVFTNQVGVGTDKLNINHRIFSPISDVSALLYNFRAEKSIICPHISSICVKFS